MIALGRRWPYLLALITLLAPTGCERKPPAAAGGSSPPSAAVERVTVGTPVRKTLVLATSQPGQIEAFEQAPIFAKIAGYVEHVGVDIGDAVKHERTLIKLNVPEMEDDVKQKEALVAQAEAELKQAEAAIDGAKAGVVSAEAKIAQAEAGIVRTNADFERWTAEYARIKALAEARSVTEKLAEETLNQLRAAEAAKKETASAVRSAEATAAEAKTNVAKAQADRAAAAARLEVAKANLARTTTLLRYTDIKAPFDGVVTRRHVDTGHFVSPPGTGAQPLLVVCRTDDVRIFVDVPELDAERVGTDDKAVVRVQALGGRTFDAKVTRTSWSLDASNRSLRTEIDVPNKEGLLRPGMFATVTITLEERPDVLTVPTTAVVKEGGQTFVCGVKEGKIERLKVETGLRVGADIEIRSGLAPEQKIVVSAAGALKPGQAVETATAEKK